MTASVSNPQAPGQLQSHYAPRKKVLIGNINELLKDFDRVGVLSFREKYYSGKIEKQIVLSSSGDLEETAQKLFSSLRELDKSNVDVILTELIPDVGLGRAINDRLRRAAT
jgi:L-threonylcarbamoyladenylate synthase